MLHRGCLQVLLEFFSPSCGLSTTHLNKSPNKNSILILKYKCNEIDNTWKELYLNNL